MSTRLLALAMIGALLTACTPALNGTWNLDVVDADDCSMELDIDVDGDDVDGDADVDCRLFFFFYGEEFYYDMDASGADVTGDYDAGDGEFEIEVSFYDSFFENNVLIELEGEIDGDDMDGEVTVDGADFGDFEGSRD